MNVKRIAYSFFILCFAFLGFVRAEEPKKSGTIIGELKSMKNINDGKNTLIEVLSPGEEKARSYFVNHDPKIKGPIPDVLKAVRAAKVGDTVEFEWVGTGHGPEITKFKVFKKGAGNTESPKPVHPEPRRYHAGLLIHLDGDKIQAAGLNKFDVAEAMNHFLDHHAKFKLSDLRAVKIGTGNGKTVPLGDFLIIDVELDRGTPHDRK